MEALSDRAVGSEELATVMGWPADPERAMAVAATLVADGLASEIDGRYRLGS